MRLEGLEQAVGLWEPREQRIVIKRSQLAICKAMREHFCMNGPRDHWSAGC